MKTNLLKLGAQLCLLSCPVGALADDAVTLASWTFDNGYDVATVDGNSVYTPNSGDPSDVTVWFKDGAPLLLPNTCVGTQSDYVCTAWSKDRYCSLCSGYNTRVFRIENNVANAITDYTDASQHNVYYEISFPTTGYKDIQIVYACAYGSNTEAPIEAVVSTDNGASWGDAGSNTTSNCWWIQTERTVSISAQNKEKVIVRLIAGNDLASNWNLDYINVKGVAAEQFNETFALNTSTSIAGAGSITVEPSGSEFEAGTELSVTTTANFGYRFVNWTDGEGNVVSEKAHFTFTLTGVTTLVANYEEVKTFALTYSIEGISATHLISVAPAPHVIDGKNMYEEGQTVVLTASDNDVVSFLSWDNGASTEKSYSIVMDADRSVVATYTNSNYIVGWDLVNQTPKKSRVADFCSEADNQGLMNLTNDGATAGGWLSHTGWVGYPCAISWQNIASRYYFQWQFATTGKKNITFKLTHSTINYSRYSTYNLDYSIDNSNWTTLETYDRSTETGWQTNSVTLPSAADNQEAVYVRLIPSADATVLGSGNDCLGVTNIFVTYDNGSDDSDKTAPQLLSTLPAQGGTDVSTSGAVILTFDEDLVLAEGAAATLDGESIVPTLSGKTALFSYSALAFNTAYTFVLPAGSLTDASGNAYAEDVRIDFTTAQRTQPAARMFDAVVAQDGSGDYKTLQDAIDAAPTYRAMPWLIFVKAGTYTGHVNIPSSKPYIHIIGEDRNLVNIEDKKLEGGLGNVTPSSTDVYELQADGTAFSVYDGATVVTRSSNLYFEGVNLVNSYGRDEKNGPQALALFTDGDRVVLNKCGLISFQDTYLTAYSNAAWRHYVKNCWIEGAVDFIYGGGDVYFDQDTINIVRQTNGYIVAPSHTKDTKWGYVFDHNVITSTIVDDPTQTKCYLGRPWTNQPKTVYLHTQCEISTYDGLWFDHMGGLPAIWAVYDMVDKNGQAMSTTSISEYYYTNKETGEKVTGTAKNSLTDEEAAQYTIKNCLRGSDAWQPELLCEATDAPAILLSDDTLRWEAVPYAISYVVLKDGLAWQFTADTNFAVSADDAATYSVKAVSEYGSLSAASNAVVVEAAADGISTIKAAPASACFYNLQGQKVVAPTPGICFSNGRKFLLQ